MKDDPQSYINLLNALARKHPVRAFFVMFFAGHGFVDFILLFNNGYVPLALYMKILVGFVMASSVLYSAFGGKNGNT